jgi:hypothetical protein
MRFWRKDRLARIQFVTLVSCGMVFFATFSGAQAVKQKPAKDPLAFRSNELTVAGLRPGRDKLAKAKQLYAGPWLSASAEDADVLLIRGDCTGALLRLEADKSGVIQQIILTEKGAEEAEKRQAVGHCADLSGSSLPTNTPVNKRTLRWVTGRNIGLGSTVGALHAAYGDPGNKSPSTRGGQPLELWYYAFDWAGAEVPQVMEVLCTREVDGKPGRVVEITLAAPSL